MAPTTPQQAGALSDKAILADALETFGRSREYSNCFVEATEGQLLGFVRKYIDLATAATDSAARAETGPAPLPERTRKAMGASFQAPTAMPTPEPAAADSEEDAHVIKRLSGILADVALALMGDELPDDRAELLEKLPKVAQALKFELELYRSGATPAPSNLVDAADGRGETFEWWFAREHPVTDAMVRDRKSARHSAEKEKLRTCWNASRKAPSQPAAPAGDNLASMTRMFHAACADLGLISEELGLDPDDDGGAEPIIDAIESLKSERDKWVDAQFSAQATAAMPDENSTEFRAACSMAQKAGEAGVGPCGVFIAGYRALRGIAVDVGDPAPATATRAEASEIEQYLLSVLPSVYYMDPPDGGSVSLLEQLRRMADDAAKYRAVAQPASVDAVPVAWMWRDGGSWELSFVPDDGSKPDGATACRPLYQVLPTSTDTVPIYQLWGGGDDWRDVSVDLYKTFKHNSRRIVYTAPPASTSADAHELWAVAQLHPNEGIEDGVARIKDLQKIAAGAQPPVTTKGFAGCAECPDEPECAYHRCCIQQQYAKAATNAQAPVDFPYQRTFNAIAAATEIAGGNISISVRKFQEAYNAAPAQPAVVPVAVEAKETVARSFLSEADMAALFTVHEQMDDTDAGGYTARKETMKRLAELGLVNSLGFGRYQVTSFGTWLIEAHFEQKPSLPLQTIAEWNTRSARAASAPAAPQEPV